MQARSRARDPLTSIEAGVLAEEFAGSHQQRILAALLAGGPQSAEQLAATMECAGMGTVAICRRLPELQRAGLARPSGRARKNCNRRSERVWEAVAVAAGMDGHGQLALL